MNKRIVLSGMRPTGRLHLGNVIGALSNWIRLQNDPNYECYYMVADWHALTTEYHDAPQIEANIEDMVLDWIACGLSPEKSTIFRQSWIPEHSELALLLSMITPLSWLERIPTYKEQMVELKEKEISTHGFLGYPVLQAADILLYRATHVPVGEDQLPHLELTREIARRFNYLYKGSVFVEPQAILAESAKVLGIDGRKMSKSYDNCVYVSDSESELKKKINSMFTDPLKIKANDMGHPKPCSENLTGCVVFSLHEVFDKSKEKVNKIEESCRNGTLGCVQCKKELFDKMNIILKPQREKREELQQKKGFVKDVLESGTQRARKQVVQTMGDVKKAIGFSASNGEK